MAYGVDLDGDGNLADSEVSSTQYLCNGPTGPQGLRGETGPVGTMGAAGTQGPAGAQGEVGATGPVGPQGAAGPAGAPGEQGPQGLPGANGETPVVTDLLVGDANCPSGGVKVSLNGVDTYLCNGEAGAAGVVGPQGPMGPAGPAGPVGADGAVGPQGAKGDTGEQGLQGEKGDTGAQGPQGIQGVDGETPVITTLAQSSVACPTGGVQISIGGNDYVACNGAKGDTGLQGVKGDTGAQGAKGDTGEQGLQGEKGDTGAQGPQGIQGAAGETPVITTLAQSSVACPTGGVQISIGGNDYVACNGAKGDTGLQGAKGDTGEQGPQGIQGAKGDTGATGFLASGSAAGVMPYWDGSAWVLNATNLYNDGSSLGINLGAAAPGAKLDVRSNTAYGAFRMQDGSQGQGKVLTSDANGSATWSTNVALTPAVIGTFGPGYSGTSTSSEATGTSIDLPPGKWSVQTTVLLAASNPPASGQAVWVRLYYSDTAAGATGTVDGVPGGGGLISGSYVGPSPFSLATGTVVINNTGSSIKTYHLVKGVHDNSAGYTISLSNLAGNAYPENNIVAYPMN